MDATGRWRERGRTAAKELNEISTADAGAYAAAACPIIRTLLLTDGSCSLAPESALTKSSRCSARAAWERCTRLGTRVWIARSPSRSCLVTSLAIPRRLVVRAAKRAARTGDQYVIAPSGPGS